MTFVPKPETAQWEAPPGFAPWRELSDEDFERLEAEYDAQFSDDQRGGMRRFFDHVPDAPAAAPRGRTKHTSATGDTAGAGR